VQNAIIGDDNSVTGGLIGAATLLGVNYLVVRFLFRHKRLDQIIEGQPTTLIEQGRLRKRALARELMTESELLNVAHRQGFSSLKDIHTCVLEPGGTFFMQGRTPPLEERRHNVILARLDELSRRLSDLQQAREI
jgi:uncharacterized membrane protein YcaP (DUF421 family)